MFFLQKETEETERTEDGRRRTDEARERIAGESRRDLPRRGDDHGSPLGGGGTEAVVLFLQKETEVTEGRGAGF